MPHHPPGSRPGRADRAGRPRPWSGHRRGGGLTKDAVYLRGLRDLVDYLEGGGAFEPLFVGKFALTHRVVLDQLIDEGWVVAPEVMPRYCSQPGFAERLAHCRSLPVTRLFHKEPTQ